MSASVDDDHHLRYSYRADVAPLHEALNSPSPLGNILDKIHRSHSGDGSQQNLSPDYHDSEKSEYSIFGEGSVATSVVSTVVDGVRHTISHWKILLYGQLISFFLAAAGAASEELNGTCHISIPITQTALVGGVLMFLGAFKMRGWFAGCRLARRTKNTSHDDSEEEESVDGENNQNTIQLPLNSDGDHFSFGDDKTDDGWATDDEHPASPIAKSSRIQSSQPRSFCCGLQTIHAPWWYYFCICALTHLLPSKILF